MVTGSVLLDEPFGGREIVALLLVGAALTLVLVLPAPSGSAASAGR
jgi:hypothetical protein